MKRKTLWLIVVICLIIVAIAVACVVFPLQNGPHKAFPALKAEDVIAVDVTFDTYPPYPMTEADRTSLVALLQKIEVTRETDEYRDYDGITTQMFVLHLADGTEMTVAASPPFLIVDGRGYRCEDGSAAEIQAIYNTYVSSIQAESEPVAES